MVKDQTAAPTNDPTATIQRMFAAFKSGDLEALIATVHPDSRWTYFGANPQSTKAEFAGKERVRKFFERILARLEVTAFNTDEYVVQGETVVVFGSESGTVKATGETFHNEWSQKYVVQNNQITEMVEYNIQIESQN